MYGLKLGLSFLIIICALGTHAGANSDSDGDIPLSRIRGSAGPTLKFFYCYSCGYRKVFDDYVNILQQKYPGLNIDGENFNPAGYKLFLAKFLGMSKILVIIIILCGINVFAPLGIRQPSWWQWCTDNRLYACMMLFFLCNAIEGQLIASGAFEILLNDVPVWSKLETGRIPQPPELFQIIDSHMQFGTMAVEHDGFGK
ncbi:thioredoxin reductase-like selenoprotein T homolog CG3887 [Diprion similis]|uniref:thioredoxin reductase-like selenoprotein T homolog CG3887 n=1 Tax=Diprion similis TaxID=362088 RepID=UPI001EF87FB0|nr:thioredoxin reductase-like selenoprotein T homolog CG3887 [Diprion similis]